jgi:predicted transcriptional regulator
MHGSMQSPCYVSPKIHIKLYLPSGKYSGSIATMESFSEQLRRTILDCGRSRYEISQETGIAESMLSRFIHGERGLSLKSIDVLMKFLALEIRPHRKRKDT